MSTYRTIWKAALTISLVMAMTFARAEAPDPGVGALLWPAIVVVGSVAKVHDLIFGSDENSKKAANEEAKKILDAYSEKISVNGLYFDSIYLRFILKELLVAYQIPFVEIDTAGTKWLLSEMRPTAKMINDASNSRFVRLSLGDDTNPDCLEWKYKSDDWTKFIPLRPGACLVAAFENEIHSNLMLRVDASKVSQRELRWELLDSSSNRVLISVPFWESQSEGKPVSALPHISSAFYGIMRKLEPIHVPLNAEQKPYVMTSIKETAAPSERNMDQIRRVGNVRKPQLAWSDISPRAHTESWADAYRRAYRTGAPTLLNAEYLILPREDRFGKVSAEWGYDLRVVQEYGLLAAAYSKSYSFSNGETTLMNVRVSGRTFTGRMFWNIRIEPDALSGELLACADPANSCDFYPRDIQITDTELVVLGSFGATNHRDIDIKSPYEWAVPLSELPPLPSNAVAEN
jgi:hypothetical protein